MVTGDSQEEVLIFRDRQKDRQTHMHLNIYIIIIEVQVEESYPADPVISEAFIHMCGQAQVSTRQHKEPMQ